MLATKVLASGITHLTDARYFAAWEVDFLAFPLGEGVSDPISWDYLNALREWVEGPAIVAELGAADDGASWAAVLAEQKVVYALVSAEAEATEALAARGIKIITHVPVAGYQSLEDVAETLAAQSSAEYVLLDFESGGITWSDLRAGHPFDLAALDTLLRQRPCLLQISLDEQDPVEIKTVHPVAGYAVRGSSEEKVGYKSFDDLDSLFEGLEVFE